MNDMDRRIQNLENVAANPNHTNQETGMGNVVVVRGFARDTRRSDIMGFLQGLLNDTTYASTAEAYAPFRRGSIGKIRFPTPQAARDAMATLRRAAPARAQAEGLGSMWVAPERSAADVARARPWTTAAWLVREKLGVPGVAAEVSTKKLRDATDNVATETNTVGEITLTPSGERLLRMAPDAWRRLLADAEAAEAA